MWEKEEGRRKGLKGGQERGRVKGGKGGGEGLMGGRGEGLDKLSVY